jgi:hypothetical protein
VKSAQKHLSVKRPIRVTLRRRIRSRGRNICADSGVSLNMRKRWRVALPVIGIILFSVVSYHSLRVAREIPGRYFWWSSIRLDSDPSNRRNWGAIPCQDGKENCWELRTIWVDPGLLDQFLMLSALPTFAAGGFAVRSLGRMGINQAPGSASPFSFRLFEITKALVQTSGRRMAQEHLDVFREWLRWQGLSTTS